MKRPTRLERFAKVFPFLALGAGLCAAGLYAEYRLNGTLLLRSAHEWTTTSIRGGRLAGPQGDYSLSFANTRLDWRLVRRGPPGARPALEAAALPGWRLEVHEAAAGALPMPEGTPLEGGLRLQTDGSVEALARAGAKDLLLRFVPDPPDPSAQESPAARADMRDIAASARAAGIEGR